MTVLRPLVELAIRGYRRWISGRGPLRRVRCSFAPDESCSAYGLRITREAPTTAIAIGRIRRRLRRCREACLVADGRALSWSGCHDASPTELERRLVEDGERPAAVAIMLAARAGVAAWRSDRDTLRMIRSLAGGLPRPRVVSRGAMIGRARRRVTGLSLLAVAALVAVVAHPIAGGIALVGALVAAVSTTRAALARDARFARHQAWASRRYFEGSAALGAGAGAGAAPPSLGSSASTTR